MKLQTVLLLAVAMFATVGCSKHDDNKAALGDTVVQNYSGTIDAMSGCGQSCRQSVTVNADVHDHPTDRVTAYLCRNADCRVSVPATSCAAVSLANSPTASCATTIPSPNIILGKNFVQFIDAFETSCVDVACATKIPGYSTYAIQTTVVR